VPDVIRTEWERARPGFINFLTADLAKVRAHSAHDVALSAAEARYPIVMLGGGLAAVVVWFVVARLRVM